MRHPDLVRGLVLVGPTMDPTARTAARQILRRLRDTAREDPLQLPGSCRSVSWPWYRAHNANYGAADRLTDLILAFLRQRILAQDSQAG